MLAIVQVEFPERLNCESVVYDYYQYERKFEGFYNLKELYEAEELSDADI